VAQPQVRWRPAPHWDTLARRERLWESIWVKRIAFACFGSAFAGSLIGAGLLAWMSQAGAPTASAALPGGAELVERLLAVESRLAAIEPRVRVQPAVGGAAQAVAPTTFPASATADDPAPIDSPVFEAAVVDIIARAEESRDTERAAAREDKHRQRTAYWANELTMRLGLSPAQTERLLAIQTRLEADLGRQRSTTSDGEFIPREVRVEARTALRQRAEEQLRGVLAPRQLAAYDSLGDQLKLYRPKGD
jgi:hypothetical protein